MFWLFWKLTFAAAVVLIATGPFSSASGNIQAANQNTAKTRPLDPAQLKAQVEKAKQYYKDALEVETVPLLETAHFIVVGQWPKRATELIGGDLEQAYTKACKVLELPAEPGPWQGKLPVFLLHDAKHYPKMIRLLQRRKADEDECGSHAASATLPHVVASPGKAPGDLDVGGTACIQMSGLLADLKAKTRLPEWLTEGFGRATLHHIGPAAALAVERRKISAILSKTPRKADDILTNNLQPAELPVLRASLVDYLAYSGRTAKFLPFIQGFGPDVDLDAALKKANLTRDELTNNWTNYARSFK